MSLADGDKPSTNMNTGKFTTRAALLWATIPQDAREQILANVFCGNCRDSVQIVKFTGEEDKGDVILKGSCAACGQAVVRVVETSEADTSRN